MAQVWTVTAAIVLPLFAISVINSVNFGEKEENESAAVNLPELILGDPAGTSEAPARLRKDRLGTHPVLLESGGARELRAASPHSLRSDI